MTGFLLPPCSLPTYFSPPSACQFLMYLYLYLHICICITNIEMSGTPLVKVFQNSDPLGNKLVFKCYFQVDCLAPAWNKGGLATWLDSGTYRCCCSVAIAIVVAIPYHTIPCIPYYIIIIAIFQVLLAMLLSSAGGLILDFAVARCF